MTRRKEEYGAVRRYRGVSVRLTRVRMGRARRVTEKKGDAEKRAAYECGFNPFDDARNRLDIRFYLVAIRFRRFDLEGSYRYPWAVSRGEQTSLGWRTMRDFMRELVVGYIYAWKVGALEWE